MFSYLKTFFLLVFVLQTTVFLVSGQEEKPKNTDEKTAKEKKKDDKPLSFQNATVDQIVESAIVIYGIRENLKQIRKTTIERGKLTVTNPDNTVDNANYERRILRGDSLDKEKIRLDQKYPNTEFALIYDAGKVFGLLGDLVFTPRQEAVKSFQNQIWHSLEGLLRYKENGSKIELLGREKQLGVEFFIIQLTDKENRVTKFFMSTKTVRIMSLEYTVDAVKFQRRFYDYRYAQGTLVPYRTTLSADNKQIEESTISTITFGQKLEDSYFQGG